MRVILGLFLLGFLIWIALFVFNFLLYLVVLIFSGIVMGISGIIGLFRSNK